MSDRDLIARVLDGDTKTFGQLVQRYQKLIYRLAYAYVGNHDDADDLVQSIFLRAYDKLSSFRGESAFKTWLYRIGVNHCLNHVAKDQRRKEQQLESLPEIASPARRHSIHFLGNGRKRSFVKPSAGFPRSSRKW